MKIIKDMRSRSLCIPLLIWISSTFSFAVSINLKERVVAAVNCGGYEALGAHGIVYSADTSEDGTASDVGMQYSFNNAEADDTEIYQTERWSKESFEYTVPASDGKYVIILKFSEVYFQRSGEKVFHVRINSHTAVKNLDIFEEAGGRGFAHDVYIPIEIKGNSISIQGHPRDYKGKIIIEFAKGPHDNPKVNGFVVLRGTLEEMPPPPAKHVLDTQFEEDFDIYENDAKEDSFKPQVIRGDDEDDEQIFSFATPGSENPFEQHFVQESSEWWLMVVAALIVIIPIAYVIQMKVNETRNQ